MHTRRSSRINRESDEFIVVNDYFDNEDSSSNILKQTTVNDIGVNTENDAENVTIEQCLDGYYDDKKNLTQNNIITMDYEDSLNPHSYEGCKWICCGLFNCIKSVGSNCAMLIKYPMLFAFVIVISSMIMGYFTYSIVNHSVGFVAKCEYFPEEKRCLYNTPLSIANPMEYHRNFVRKNTYIRITNSSLEYWNPWMYKVITKIDPDDCNDYSCNIIGNKQVIIAVNNSIDKINSKVIDKYSDINQITIVNENKWISINDIEPVILRTLTDKMFELKEGKTEIDNTTYLTNTRYTHIYTIFTLVTISTYIFIMM